MKAKLDKPAGCNGCTLHHNGVGFVRPQGPASARIALVGAHAGYDEAAVGQPFIGAAGGMLTRLLSANSWTRDQFSIGNQLFCCPPGAEIKKAQFIAAAGHCAQYRDPWLAEHPVIMALGIKAIRQTLNLWDLPSKYANVENFHGTVTQLPSGQYVVGGFHPAQLQQGSHNLFRVSSFDLQVAHDVATGAWTPDPIEPIIDPPLDWLDAYIDQFLAYAAQSPDEAWLACDMETLDTRGKSEADLGEDDRSYHILRNNFACNGEQGVTFRHDGPYRDRAKRLIEQAPVTLWWNNNYDLPRYRRAGIEPTASFARRMVLDGMWLAKHLQSDVPLGLGFWAPFYSRHGAWKHLADRAPGEYAAYDGPQTYRTVAGIAADLVAAGKWEIAHRHSVRLMEHVLRPATIVGVRVDREKLQAFEDKLTTEARRLIHAMQANVPEELLPLTPKGGLAHRPKRDVHAKGTDLTAKGEKKADAEEMDPLKLELYAEFAEIVEKVEKRTVLCCRLCGDTDILRSHRCDKKAERSTELKELPIQRWYWREPFNPDSPAQWLAYIAAKGHKPGRNKKTRKDSADRETLQRLARTTRDPVYQQGLDLRAVVKVRSTYAIGVRRRLDSDDRFHPEFTRRPSMFRISSVAPNITNVVADKGDKKKSIAAGFRGCVVATPGEPPWWDEMSEAEKLEYL